MSTATRPAENVPHAVYHRPPGGRWVLVGVYQSRAAAWDVAFDLPRGAIRVAARPAPPVAPDLFTPAGASGPPCPDRRPERPQLPAAEIGPQTRR